MDFKNTLIILTSNVGSSVIEKGGGGIGFQLDSNEEDSSYNRIKSLVNEELKQYFRRVRTWKGRVVLGRQGEGVGGAGSRAATPVCSLAVGELPVSAAAAVPALLLQCPLTPAWHALARAGPSSSTVWMKSSCSAS